MNSALPKQVVSPSQPVQETGNVIKQQRSASTMQTDVMLMPVICVLLGFVCLVGILYIGAFVGINKEGYRRTELLSQLRTQQDMQANWQQMLAKEAGPSIVEKHAAKLNMIPAVPSQTVLLGTDE